MKKLLLFTVVMKLWLPLEAAQSKTNLRNYWFVLEKGRMRPVIDEQEHTIINFAVPNWTSGDSLKIAHQQPIDLWVNNQLLYRKLKQRTAIFSMTDLQEVARGDSLFITIRKDQYDLITTTLQSPEYARGIKKDVIIPKDPNKRSSFYIYVLIILLVGFAMLKYIFPIKFSQLMSNPFSTKTASDLDAFYASFFALENLATMLLFSLIGSLQIMYLNNGFHFWSYLSTWDNLFSMWLFVAFIIFSFLVIKYILARAISGMMEIRNMPDVQLQDFIQLLVLLGTLNIIFLFLDQYFFSQRTQIFVNFSFYISIIVLLSFQLWLYFKLDKFYSRKKLLIISYLCTTEFLPVFLIMYWLLK